MPKAERRRLREIGTEEAYQDWRLRLAGEAMEEARRQVEILWEKKQQWEEEKLLRVWDLAEGLQENSGDWGNEGRGSGMDTGEYPGEEALWLAMDRWTDACLEWYQNTEENDEEEKAQ